MNCQSMGRLLILGLFALSVLGCSEVNQPNGAKKASKPTVDKSQDAAPADTAAGDTSGLVTGQGDPDDDPPIEVPLPGKVDPNAKDSTPPANGDPQPQPEGMAGVPFNFTNYAVVPGWKDLLANDSLIRDFTGDFTGDGKSDYAFFAPDGTIWVGVSNGANFGFQRWYYQPGWNEVFAANSLGRFFVGNFNGDNKMDVGFAYADGSIWIGISDGTQFIFSNWYRNGAWGPIFRPGSGGRTDLGDFNGDGKTDFMFTWVDGTWWVGLSINNTFVFQNWKSEPGWRTVIDASSPARTFVADINGDGKSDYLFTWADGNIWAGFSDGTKFNFGIVAGKPEWKDVLVASSPARMFPGDFNGDGKADLFFVWPDGNWWVGTSNGAQLSFSPFASTPDWQGVLAPGSAVRVLPFSSNGDAKLDVMFTWVDGSFWVGESTGTSFNFRLLFQNKDWGPIFDIRSKARIHLGNFNGDNKLDFLFTWLDGTWWVGQ